MNKKIVLGLFTLFLVPNLRANVGDCGRVSNQGQCTGSELSYCVDINTANEHVVVVDCGDEVFPSDIEGICITVNDNYGADCAVPEGGRCLFEDEQHNAVVAYCGGTNAGCVIDEVNHSSVCQANIGPCSAPDPGQSFAPLCANDVLIAACQEGQPVATDCLALGGSCSAGACSNLPIDSACDSEQRLCAAGSFCHDDLHRCVDNQDVCDAETRAPSCSEDILTYCSMPHELLQDVDCNQTLGPNSGMSCGTAYSCVDDGVSGACGDVPMACVGSGEGTLCSVELGFFCSSGLGCVMQLDQNGDKHESCRSTDNCAFADLHKGCVGDIATFCLGSQERTVVEAAGIDCASLGSSCSVDPTLGPLCVGDEGALCDDVSRVPNSPFRCAQGLVCRVSSNAFGTCVVPDEDGGIVDDANRDDLARTDTFRNDSGMDAGSDAAATSDASQDASGAKPPAEGCGCVALADASPSLGFAFALLVARHAWRRRRKNTV